MVEKTRGNLELAVSQEQLMIDLEEHKAELTFNLTTTVSSVDAPRLASGYTY